MDDILHVASCIMLKESSNQNLLGLAMPFLLTKLSSAVEENKEFWTQIL